MLLDFETPRITPCVSIRPALGDNPDTHRWRARIYPEFGMIDISPYPVVKLTRCGAWIDPTGWWLSDSEGWNISEHKVCHKWVADGSGRSWAKRTKAEALESAAIRLAKWYATLQRDLREAMGRAALVRELLPEYAHHLREVPE